MLRSPGRGGICNAGVGLVAYIRMHHGIFCWILHIEGPQGTCDNVLSPRLMKTWFCQVS